MKISMPNVEVAKGLKGPSSAQAPQASSGGFRELLNSLRDQGNFAQISEMQQKIIGKKSIPNQDLILYQVQVQHFSTRVEMLSKVAESGVATIRKLQQGQ